MKKLLTIAIAAAIAAPMAVSADTTIYGRINTAVVHGSTGAGDEWDVEGNASRFGVKGSEDLGNGLKAIFQYEWGVDSADSGDFSGRLAYAGLTGGFGTVALGRQWTPYYGSVDKTDIFQVVGINDHYLGVTRVGNTLAYVSPDFNGLSAKVALIMADETPFSLSSPNTGEDGIDVYNVSVDYNNGPLSVGVSYLGFEGALDSELVGIGAKYNFGNFAIIGQYEDFSAPVSALDSDSWGLAAEAYFGNNTVRAMFGQAEVAGVDFDTWAVGVEHAFSKRTRVFAEYEDSELNAATDDDRFGVGIRHDF
ncbi:porin [Sedimenticola hydrogenitrophicus]|uniref:porin n=1 Tax=Sedimenticola hydrogenitrophicus TaxID=2967975 RepID=UPI0023AF9607|nr:porin [Sedimenticola hydrogenitrophicus]